MIIKGNNRSDKKKNLINLISFRCININKFLVFQLSFNILIIEYFLIKF